MTDPVDAVLSRRRAEERAAASVTHRCPPNGSGAMTCCGRTPFEVPSGDRITLDPKLVTCGRAPSVDLARVADEVATDVESWLGTPIPSWVAVERVAKRLRAALAGERCAFVYTSHAPAWRDGIPCPFTRDQHPLLHEWLDR